MTETQALQIYDLLQTDAYTSLDDDAARLTKLNAADKSRAARAIDSKTLLAWSYTSGLYQRLKLAQMDADTTDQAKAEIAGLLLVLERDNTTIDLGDANQADKLTALQTAGLLTSDDAADLALLAWPSPARRILGRDATADDVTAATTVGEAKETLTTAIATAKTTYETARDAALRI